jgi:uncharacterized protein (TIGR03435 family)
MTSWVFTLGTPSVLGAALVAATTVSRPAHDVFARSPAATPKQSAGQSLVRPEFEIASVKPNRTTGPARLGVAFLPGGRVSATAPLALLIAVAYDISMRDIVGGQPLLSDRFDIEARAGVSAVSPDAPAEDRTRHLRLMLQSLLAKRFKLAIHTDTKETPIYALVVTKSGPGLRPSPADRECPDLPCGSVGGGPATGLRGYNAEVSTLADALTLFLDRPVIDRTSLRGRFDIVVPPWRSRDASQEVTTLDASVFTLLEEQLGLRLEPTNGPRDVYVIDHIEAPTPD